MANPDLPQPKKLRQTVQFQPRWEDLNVDCLAKCVWKSCRGQATFLRLPPLCQIALLNRVADVCHGLKGLSLHRCSLIYSSSIIPELIGKCKHLELLSLRGGSNNLKELLLQISIHCKNFCRLLVLNAVIGREDALAIVNLVPNIKYLSLRKSYIHRDNLVTLFRCCKELMLLDARDCSGFDGSDVEILALASRIDKFSCEGSRNGDWKS
ncbi:hypothetical protein L3X38_002687 [Prunus dulcis]|uniref:RNI-like superfamily protein n=1 Tax=Prunus dulcis TaxID=3755 RepID=A0AAD4WUY0_PRUDU|nr:hypothetical protein L3X38_002687 [Prunus dulcis]